MIAYNFMKTSNEAGVVYSELRFSPLIFTHSELAADENMLTYDEAVDAVARGLDKGKKDFGVEYRMIICLLYTKPG